MVRRFLWIITALILLALGAALAFRLFAPDLMRAAFVPSEEFSAERIPPGIDYARSEAWIARPDLAKNPSQWLPPGVTPEPPLPALVFFVHPTSYLDRARWNAPLDDEEANRLARLFVRSQASAFSGAGTVWAPRYRQATVGAFLTGKPDAAQAIELAYGDVIAAFDRFLAEAPADLPIVLAGHSQGSRHLLRLLKERAGKRPLASRIAAVYAIGWPVSTTADLPATGLPPCRTALDSGCVLAWQSFAEPADPDDLFERYEASTGADGAPRAGTQILCVNPLSGTLGGTAPAGANRGTLIPNGDFSAATLKPGLVPARCDERGLLLIGRDPPSLPRYVLPGNNYHVFDYALFWANVRADARRRVAEFIAQ